MATYAIGDVQGCFTALQALLVKIQFDPTQDTLWFTGDLVNRGPQSLEVLRFIKNLDGKHISVLGNHDLHLLAVAYGLRSLHSKDTLQNILTAPDKQELIDWLRHRPLIHHDAKLAYTLVHAGLAPSWSLKTALSLAHEVEATLRSQTPEDFLTHMYGNEPNQWHANLQGIDRLRCIVNYCTRMRFCHVNGSLDLNYKGTLADKPAGLIPWFDVKKRRNREERIIFGHWAALGGETDVANLYPLDTGCVWSNCLTAFCLDNEKRIGVQC